MLMRFATAVLMALQLQSAYASADAVCKKDEVAGYQTKLGIVPTGEIAVALARQVILGAYGDAVLSLMELTAKASGDDWEVIARPHKHRGNGSITVRMNRCTGRVTFLFIDK